MYWGFWGFGPGFWGILGGLLWVVIWALLIWGLIHWFASGNRRRPYSYPDQQPDDPSALEILRQRYARGDIDAATFEQMRERLEHADGPVE
jgi:putative membrane protein